MQRGEGPPFAFDHLLVTSNGKAVWLEVVVDHNDSTLLKAIVGKDSKTKAVVCHGVSHKGLSEESFAVDRVVEKLRLFNAYRFEGHCKGRGSWGANDPPG